MRTNAMPGFGKLASINPDFDVNVLPDFDDEVPTASNLVSKKEKTKQNHQNISPQQSVSKKRNRKVAARKTSTIRDRIKQYEKISNKAKEEQRNSVIIKTSKSAENTTDKTKETKETKNDKNISIYTDKTPPPTLKTQTNHMSESDTKNNAAPLIKKQMFSEIESEMLASIIISPMNSANLANTSTPTVTPTDLFALDKDDSCTTPIVIQSKSQDLALNGHGADAPPPAYTAYDTKATNSPSAATDDMSKDTSISFDAVYEPSYRNDVVSFPSLRRGTAHRVSDGNVMRDVIKQQIAEKEVRKAKLKRKHSKFTEFGAKNRTKINLWGRKMNSFATKHGQQAIIEWRFASSDNMTHTLVLQHEQIKKKKKSKRMVILDGKERYSHKSKQTEFRLCVPGCGDVLDVSIEYRKAKGIKYSYRLKINDMPYSVVFHKWSKAHR